MKDLPKTPKKLGKSKYFITTYTDSSCKTIKTEKIPFPFIKSDYEDGSCVQPEENSESYF